MAAGVASGWKMWIFCKRKALSLEAQGFLLGEGLFDLEFLITRKDSARLRRVLNLEEKGTRQRRAPSGFAMLTTFPKAQREAMMFKIATLCISYWTFATIVGVVLGDSVADYIPNLDFALPCLFAILAYEQYKNQRQWKPMLIALIGFLAASQITETSVLLVAILLAIVIVALLPSHHSTETHTEKKDEHQ